MTRAFLAGVTAGGLVGMAFARRWCRTTETTPDPAPCLPPRVIADMEFGGRAARIIVAEDARRAAMRGHPSSSLSDAELSESERLLRRAFPEVGL